MKKACSHMNLQSRIISDACSLFLRGEITHTTACKSCLNLCGNLLCPHCKDVFCGNKHIIEHHQKTDHYLTMDCSTGAVRCRFCYLTVDFQVVNEDPLFSLAALFLEKESIDEVVDDFDDILSKSLHSFVDSQYLEGKSFEGKDRVALAEEGLLNIINSGFDSLADPKVREDFLIYSSALLADESCSSGLKHDLSAVLCNLSEEISAYIRAKTHVMSALSLSALITQNNFVVQQQTIKYLELKNNMVTSDEKIAYLKAAIEDQEAQLIKLKDSLTAEEISRTEMDEATDTIKKQVTDARNRLVKVLEQLSSMDESLQTAKKLVARKELEWENLEGSIACPWSIKNVSTSST